MSLAPGEEQVLAEIESRLRWSDPRLAARLALFGRRGFREPGPARERLSPWRARRSRAIRIVLLAVTVSLAVAALALSVYASQSGDAAPRACGLYAPCRQAQQACCLSGRAAS